MTGNDGLISPMDLVVERLGEVKKGQAKCPAHEDRKPSLSVTEGLDGRVLLCCHAGCPTEDIVAALGLRWEDLYPPRDARDDRPRIVATYDYVSEHGELLYQSVRYEPKDFRQRRPNERGGWDWKLGDVRRVLYQLPQVLAAAKAGEVIYICEGEKDAAALGRAGVVATTNPMGAGSWRSEYAVHLVGASRVVVVADRDPKGRDHARRVAQSVRSVGVPVSVVESAFGKDAADHLAAGRTVEEFVRCEMEQMVSTGKTAAHADEHKPSSTEHRHDVRTVSLTPASAIRVRPVRWLWEYRVALGTLALVGGREGIGKSMVCYWIAAALTRGGLPGIYFGQPKSVIVAATEDSWEHTIVPRLMAADADLDQVFRVDVTTATGFGGSLVLPKDLDALRQHIRENGSAALLLDPLISRLDGGLDTHKDAEVRQALEPLVALADQCAVAVFGIIHVNKSVTTDPLSMLMASRAFSAVARAVLFVTVDPDDEKVRLLGEPKNNLGSTDLPSMTFTIGGVKVADTDEGPVWTGQIRWGADDPRQIGEVLRNVGESDESRSLTDEASDWLSDYLAIHTVVDSNRARVDGKAAGYSASTLKRARAKIGAGSKPYGFPRRTIWSKPGMTPDEVDEWLERHWDQPSGETRHDGLTGPTGPTRLGSTPVVPVGPGSEDPTGDDPTAPRANCPECGAPPPRPGSFGIIGGCEHTWGAT
jgi:hypothetical protein